MNTQRSEFNPDKLVPKVANLSIHDPSLMRTGRCTHRGSEDSSCSSETKLFRI
jgi:hypothetical protein